ncbi:hypothetical protein Kpol_1054p37 [Vanderwaltozyma polyspora DSM 70294]|uniref:Required for respiratory growth protein 9, mitochondrial n=1 Tax=Vanderwaltozyma polyspora (strain ATCC 22028 / DSM 70294 / BCRC 21397 / CBS 2163 / NBRC 10782 / NRRL Y-8283 / UCD 57-17) TaxID=436907 RepID=RRG9_VANPO|nr:uncharacterized protein Kpol_1054p37 [Vanderwaltozyma polyspora DSM 70294]A7TIC4.1 RecName: Full=Required for respiratory growth protein 9, mitochondrial; Flags: Precursor [Vanderwaltozyma polyspora DSM 70294]EDO17990.1 hypothetical protein Kpol_1054p37 [Vanderwaltozyma polyspora DSM 70294]
MFLAVKIPIRRFHVSYKVFESSKKSAKEVIELINSSSLSNKETFDSSSNVPEWKRQKLALKSKFKGEKWNPKKKLSRVEMDTVRLLKDKIPSLTASDLGDKFKVSPEAIRRILKSKWQPSAEEISKIEDRWKKRGIRVEEIMKKRKIWNSHIGPNGVTNTLVIGSGNNSPIHTIKKMVSNNSDDKTNTSKMDLARKKSKLELLKKTLNQ